jgi:16S rRNA (uracil1498-N3)-methyltransferase
MKNLFYYPNLQESEPLITFESEEARHLKSLRIRKGDSVFLTNGMGAKAEATLIDHSRRTCELKIVNFEQVSNPKNYYIHIAVSPTKNADRIEWFVEKAVELGIDEITFLETENCTRNQVKLERVTKKAIEAMKQSLQFYLPKINDLTPFEDFVNNSATQNQENFIAYMFTNQEQSLLKKASPQKKYCVMVGSEGGFSEEEAVFAQKVGFECVNLGGTRLRAETAALASCMMLNFINV